MRIEEIPASPKKPKVTRVAAYARVSSDKDAAFHSLEAQTEYYQNYIAARPDWELVAIYSDNGISGTTLHRPEFQRMLQDCREGKIDLIITKSVTRFARNTIILLETIRELKKIGVDCYFEKEDMHSISPDGELLLTLLAMYAEEEARSASENQKWRIQKLYDQGKPAGGHTFGYRLMGERFEVVPEEAEIVKEIFRLYLSGMGYSKIARTLIEQHIPAYFGGTWSVASVRNILLNEKYAGDLLLQKTFSEDFRTKKKRKNTGELRKIYDLFLSGKTINEIAATLTSMGVLTPAGRTKWSVSTVRSILSNEKYKGEALLQKTFTVDYLTKEVRRNNGEVPSVRVRNSHEPIIEPEVFDRVQSMLATSAKRRAKVRTKLPFAGKLICGDCGSFYGHKVWRLRSTGEHYNVWYCNHKYDGDKTCDSPRLRDEEVKAAFEKMLQKCGDPNPVYTDER